MKCNFGPPGTLCVDLAFINSLKIIGACHSDRSRCKVTHSHSLNLHFDKKEREWESEKGSRTLSLALSLPLPQVQHLLLSSTTDSLLKKNPNTCWTLVWDCFAWCCWMVTWRRRRRRRRRRSQTHFLNVSIFSKCAFQKEAVDGF